MKIYKVSYHDPESGACAAYAATSHDARRIVKNIKRQDPSSYTTVSIINVPTKKAALIAWLNGNAYTEDGAGNCAIDPFDSTRGRLEDES